MRKHEVKLLSKLVTHFEYMYIISGIIIGVCTNVSTLTILGMTLEKFIAVCYPLQEKAWVRIVLILLSSNKI